jgi:ribosomal protein L7/L12
MTVLDYYFIGAIAICLFRIFSLNNRLSELENKFAKLSEKLGYVEDPPKPPSERVMSLALDPLQKIEAIKIYREETGCGLKEAKDAVEYYLEKSKGK